MHLGHKNRGNDHQLKKLLIVKQILLVSNNIESHIKVMRIKEIITN